MSTYTQILYHIVFSTKYRARTLHVNGRPSLFRYITGILKNNKCKVYRINGVEDHLHILIDLHPSISLANLIKDIKLKIQPLRGCRLRILMPRIAFGAKMLNPFGIFCEAFKSSGIHWNPSIPRKK